MGLLYSDPRPAGQAGTHVFVVGVSQYRHFPGDAEGRTILSAEEGAKAFADWVIKDFHNPDVPLASVRGLFSSLDFDLGNGTKQVTASPDWNNFKSIYGDWIAESINAPGSKLIFYFGGHGIASELSDALLLEDYNLDSGSSMDGAVDFRNLKSAVLHTSRASDAWFFVDTCRNATPLQREGGSKGRQVHSNGFPLVGSKVQVTDVKSTVLGYSARGVPGGSSIFASALVAALKNNAYVDVDGTWISSADILQTAMNVQLDKLYEELEWSEELRQRFQFSIDSRMALHMKRDGDLPQMQVSLTCKKEQNNTLHDLYWHQKTPNSVLTKRDNRLKSRWDFSLPANMYAMGALNDAGAQLGVRDVSVDKPLSKIALEF